MLNIIQKPSPNHWEGRKGYKPELIVVHIMAGNLIGTDSWFASTTSQVSSHYGVGLNGEIHQYVKEIDGAWCNGNVRSPSAKFLKPLINPNCYTISIENEGQDLSKHTEIQMKTLVALIKDIAQRNSIQIDRDHIIGHFEIDSVVKGNCPSPNHGIMDEIVALCHTEEMVSIMVPASKVERVKLFINSII